MAKEAQPVNQSLMAVMAEESRLDEAKYRLIIKNQCFRNTKRPVTEEEALAFLMVAHRYSLDPILNQIYAFMNNGTVVPIVGVDGWASIVNSHSGFDGCEFETEERDKKLYAMTCHMYVKGRSGPVSVTEYLHECFRPTNPWKTMERRMLRNKCFSQSARLCFGITGIYDHDEAERIIEGEVVEDRKTIAAPVAKDVPETHEDAPEVIQVTEMPDSEDEPGEAPESEEMEMTEESYREPGADG